jgi:hypothetical protein
MELHELGVRNHRADAGGHGDRLAARIAGVGGDGEEAAGAAGRQHDRAGGEELVGAVAECGRAQEAHAFDAAVGDDEFVSLVAFEHADRWRRAHFCDQRAHDGGAGPVAGDVYDASARVRGLAAQ